MSVLAEKLRESPYSLSTIVLSIDDLYLPYDLQKKHAASHRKNPLIQHRGQPSTHDITLATSVFSDLRNGNVTQIPAYDKSANRGQGDRVAREQWPTVNQSGGVKTMIVIFEGWCVGFRALPDQALKKAWENARKQQRDGDYSGRLGFTNFEDIEFINEALRGYDQLTGQLDLLIHIDAEDPQFVYKWRIQQETAMRESKGSGMTEDEVIGFVDGYYPSYELYTETLRRGAFNGETGKQLRLRIGEDRKVTEVLTI